jgi:phage terminase large subunit-like protein
VEVEQALPTDPGGAGVVEAHEWIKTLAGFVVNVERESGDKVTRAKVVSALFAPLPGCAHGKFRIVKGEWVGEFLSELEDFPTKGVHDDQVDALSTAFRVLVQGGGGSAGLTEEDYSRFSRRAEDPEDERISRKTPSKGALRWRR